MNVNDQSEVAERPLKSWRTMVDVLASVRFAVALIILIAAACVVGTILPQGAEIAQFLQKNPGATSRFVLFHSLGLTHVFSAWWFVVLLCLLAASVTGCSARRMATVKRSGGFARRRALGSLLTHLSILLILGGAVVRGLWGEKGYVSLREGETVSNFHANNGTRPLPFALELRKFEIETDPVVSEEVTIKNFRSTLQLHYSGGAVDQRMLAVNRPLTVKGFTFYQTGYNPDDLTWTALQVVRDPGVPLVYGGFMLLIAGQFTVFYLNPWLAAREAKL